ncbi:MAG: hypothetical protein Q9216_003731 [Gyalolechia sp. 2 TL-2023]
MAILPCCVHPKNHHYAARLSATTIARLFESPENTATRRTTSVELLRDGCIGEGVVPSKIARHLL